MPDEKTVIMIAPGEAALMFQDILVQENPDCIIKVIENYHQNKVWLFSIRKDNVDFEQEKEKEVLIAIEWRKTHHKRTMVSLVIMYGTKQEQFKTVSALLDRVHCLLNFVH